MVERNWHGKEKSSSIVQSAVHNSVDYIYKAVKEEKKRKRGGKGKKVDHDDDEDDVHDDEQ